jgi:hypothetical protein
LRLAVFNEDIAAIPEDEWHWTPWLSNSLLNIIPSVPIPIDAPSSVPIDINAFSADDEACMMTLEGNGIRIVSPVCEII